MSEWWRVVTYTNIYRLFTKKYPKDLIFAYGKTESGYKEDKC